jgi:hypothetical protein
MALMNKTFSLVSAASRFCAPKERDHAPARLANHELPFHANTEAIIVHPMGLCRVAWLVFVYWLFHLLYRATAI